MLALFFFSFELVGGLLSGSSWSSFSAFSLSRQGSWSRRMSFSKRSLTRFRLRLFPSNNLSGIYIFTLSRPETYEI